MTGYILSVPKTSGLPLRQSLLRELFFSRVGMRIGVLFLTLAAAALGLLAPYFQKVFVDKLIGLETLTELGRNSHPITLMVWAFLVSLLAFAFNHLAMLLSHRESTFSQKKIATGLYRKMLQLRTESLENRPIGEIVSLYATDIPGATIFVEQAFPLAAGIIFPLALAPIAIHFVADIPLWPIILVLGVATLLNLILAYRQARFFYSYKVRTAERTSLVNEWVQNIRMLRILSWMSPFEEKIFEKRKHETQNRLDLVTNGQVMSSLGSSITYIINIVAVLTLLRFKTTDVTPGELLALLWILGIFLNRPMRQMPWLFTFMMDSLSSLHRLEKFLKLKNTHGLATGKASQSQQKSQEGLTVKNLNLQIGSKQLLKNINLHIQKGEFVAFVGEVGSGKSLLLLSLMGETGASADSYFIDGIDMKNAPTKDLRKHFSFIPQEAFIMSASLRENVQFDYQTEVEYDQEIETSLGESQFDIGQEGLVAGLETSIGERGVNLSGGQRQRINLSRAHFFDRPFVLLDDSLSAVDVDTERQLTGNLLEKKWQGKTRILVTHRLSVLPKVDRIYFLQQGEIVASGTFPDLVKNSKIFKEFTTSLASGEKEQSQ